MADQNYWDDVEEGQEIALENEEMASQRLVVWAAASGDFYQIHYDDGFAENNRLPGIIVHGALKGMLVGRLLDEWAGDEGSIKKWGVSYRGMDPARQALRIWGKVTRKYEEGGEGNPPVWYRFGMCDTGNAFQSAIAMLQALYHRDQTGQGQFVTTSLLNCGMYYNSDYFEGGPEGLGRPALDKGQTGLGPLYRLYETAKGWLAVAAVEERHWLALCRAIGKPELAEEARFADPSARQRNADALASILEETFSRGKATHWFATLDAAGVPCELSDEERGQRMYQDPEALANGWFVSYEHAEFGKMHQFGPLVELSETPGKTGGPPPLLGEHTRAIMAELGYAEEETARLKDAGVITWSG